MKHIEITPISAFKDNYIWQLNIDESENIWVVDPGDAKPVIDFLEKNNKHLAGILITHHHPDHTGGIANLLQHSPQIKVIGGHHSPNKYLTHRLKHNDVIQCGSISFTVIEIPGHTLDHIAFYGAGALFCGDTLFSAGCGRVFEGTHEQMLASLNLLQSLPAETKIYCGHEYTLANLQFADFVTPNNSHIMKKMQEVKQIREKNGCTLPSTLDIENHINPFLRTKDLEILTAVRAHSKTNINNEAEVFSYLREWKNNFTT